MLNLILSKNGFLNLRKQYSEMFRRSTQIWWLKLNIINLGQFVFVSFDIQALKYLLGDEYSSLIMYSVQWQFKSNNPRCAAFSKKYPHFRLMPSISELLVRTTEDAYQKHSIFQTPRTRFALDIRLECACFPTWTRSRHGKTQKYTQRNRLRKSQNKHSPDNQRYTIHT